MLTRHHISSSSVRRRRSTSRTRPRCLRQRTARISEAIAALHGAEAVAVAWEEKKAASEPSEPHRGAGRGIGRWSRPSTSEDERRHRDLSARHGATSPRRSGRRSRAAWPRGTLIGLHESRRGQAGCAKLEQDLLKTGASVRRTDDDLRRYHKKINVVDRATLYVRASTTPALDVNKSRSFGVVTKKRSWSRKRSGSSRPIRCGDPTRWPQGLRREPLRTRGRGWRLPPGAPEQLLVYDPQAHRPRDDPYLAGARERRRERTRPWARWASAGGAQRPRSSPARDSTCEPSSGMGSRQFVGSQGLRKLELTAGARWA